MLTEISMPQIMMRIIAMVVLMAVHGFSLALLARAFGDRGPQYDGRLTLNPLNHLNVLGLVAGIAGRTGWIIPMDIAPKDVRDGRAGIVAIVVLSLLVLIGFGMLVLQARILAASLLDPTISNYVVMGMTTIADCAAWFAVFNLLPLPPLTGGLILAAFAPRAAAAIAKQSFWIGSAIVILMVLTRGTWMQPLVTPVRNLVFLGFGG
ncbi:hypothetical protein EMQ25_06425 [Arsenicitalea aurantiaca]|uniref:Site-2 protease family protein n=1 Tax=Arsenicitalea aurantiaca TaxID=1783274 RepID=A0A433XFJ2_9HYPH|nr:hypothetical protein [Arsenicitalea aurantiaca]RUT32774.1 hypothetical protein EMQ25_06425 [Arsenicitalea aurantiaca]